MTSCAVARVVGGRVARAGRREVATDVRVRRVVSRAVPLAVSIDASAGGTVSDDVGEVERSSSDSRAQSSRQV